MIHFCVCVLMLQAQYAHFNFTFYLVSTITVGSIENSNYYIYVAESSLKEQNEKNG